MDTVTYPDANVVRLLNDNFHLVNVHHENVELTQRYGVLWTPCFVCLSPEGQLIYQEYGFLPPAEFRALLLFMQGMAHIHSGAPDQAEKRLLEVVQCFPKTQRAPQALYWAGVSLVKQDDKEGLARVWTQLKDEYPGTLWHVKSSFLFD